MQYFYRFIFLTKPSPLWHMKQYASVLQPRLVKASLKHDLDIVWFGKNGMFFEVLCQSTTPCRSVAKSQMRKEISNLLFGSTSDVEEFVSPKKYIPSPKYLEEVCLTKRVL